MNSLDSILGGPVDGNLDDSNVISVAVALAVTDGAILAEVHRTDVVSGAEIVELVKLDAQGRRRAALAVGEHMDAAEIEFLSALRSSIDLDQLPFSTDARVLVPADASVSSEIDGIGMSRIETVAHGENHMAVLGTDAAGTALTVVSANGSRSLPLEGLQLGGKRQITDLAISENVLFVGVADAVSGFDVFRMDLNETEDFALVIGKGAYRFATNAAIASMTPTDGGVLMGTAALAGPRKPLGNWGPELLMVTSDGKWDLIAGQPRFSPDGLILPASTEAPGFGSAANAAIRNVARHGDEICVVVQEFSGVPEEDRRNVGPDLDDYAGAVRFFVSSDLEAWVEVSHSLPADIGAISHLRLTQDSIVLGHEGLGSDVTPVKVVRR